MTGLFLWDLLLNDLFETLNENGIDPGILQAYADDSLLKIKSSNRNRNSKLEAFALANRILQILHS